MSKLKHRIANRKSKLNSPLTAKAPPCPGSADNGSSPPFRFVSTGKINWLESPDLTGQPWAVHAFSTRAGTGGRLARGLNLGFTPGESRARVMRNRKSFLEAIGTKGFDLAELRQIHSTLVFRARRGDNGKVEYLPSGYPAGAKEGSPQGDALITNEPGILLSVRCADCVPILIADPEGRAVAAVHAGWKGMLGGIVEKTVGEMRRNFNSRPSDLHAAIGPSIAVCCYEVSEDLAEHFRGRFAGGEEFVVSGRSDEEAESESNRQPYSPPFLWRTPPGHGPDAVPGPHLDLVAAAKYQLMRAGLVRSHIQESGLCTSDRTDLFFSYRKEGSHTGRMMAVIGIK